MRGAWTLSAANTHCSIIAAGYGLLAGAVAFPTANSRRHVVHERREWLPINWARGNELHSEAFALRSPKTTSIKPTCS